VATRLSYCALGADGARTLSQPSHPLLMGHGNFGSVDDESAGGDALPKRSGWPRSPTRGLLDEISSDTVDFGAEISNASQQEPTVLRPLLLFLFCSRLHRQLPRGAWPPSIPPTTWPEVVEALIR